MEAQKTSAKLCAPPRLCEDFAHKSDRGNTSDGPAQRNRDRQGAAPRRESSINTQEHPKC